MPEASPTPRSSGCDTGTSRCLACLTQYWHSRGRSSHWLNCRHAICSCHGFVLICTFPCRPVRTPSRVLNPGFQENGCRRRHVRHSNASDPPSAHDVGSSAAGGTPGRCRLGFTRTGFRGGSLAGGGLPGRTFARRAFACHGVTLSDAFRAGQMPPGRTNSRLTSE